MFVLPLNLRIFKLVIGLILLSSCAILFAQWFATSQYAANLVERDLEVGQSVTRQIFESREQLLFTSADVLTQDFGFKAALASGDSATIQSALVNHRRRIASDLMVAMTLEGEVLAFSGAADAGLGQQLQNHPIIDQVLADGGAASLLVLGRRIYQAILLVVEAPDPVAITMVAFEVDEDLLQQVDSITKLNIIMSAETPTGAIVISSLSPGDEKLALAAARSGESQSGVLLNDLQSFVSTQFDFDESGAQQQVTITLTDKLGTWYADFNYLLGETFVIALLSIFVALPLGLLFANNLTRPLAALAKRARRISAGDYNTEPMAEARSTEINRLSDAFDVMQKDIQTREEKIKYQAQHDDLTGLINRAEVGNMLALRLADQSEFQIIVFKVMGFREVNTAFGLQSGDACIVSLAERIKGLGGDAARLNGSEILWMPESVLNIDDLDGILAGLEQPHVLGNLTINMPLAAGMMHLPADAETVDQLFGRLSACVDEASGDATRRVVYTSGLEDARVKRLNMLVALEQVLEEDSDELTLFYQPKLSLTHDRIEAAEALIRWNSATLGFVPPDEFIPVAEKAGLIDKVTRWVVRRAIRDVSHWRDIGLQIKVAINLSVHDISNERLMETIDQSLIDAKLSSDMFEFEITESDLMSDPDTAINLLKRFRDRGFDLAIDDFGTGYSSLAYLKNMPVSELKIDKSFVLNLAQSEEDQLICQSIIELAKRFGLKVVAEGIEDEGTLKLLQQWGCDWAQGYFISRPADPEALLVWLQENQDTKWLQYA